MLSDAVLFSWWPLSEKAVSHGLSIVTVVVYNRFGCGLGYLFPHLNIAVVLLNYSCTVLFYHICLNGSVKKMILVLTNVPTGTLLSFFIFLSFC